MVEFAREVVRIVDFGVAILREEAESEHGERLTTKGLVVGTPHYMAPEQFLGHDVGQLADLFSIGVIAYELLVGTVPYRADTPLRTLMEVVSSPLPPPRERNPNIAPDVEAVVMRALARDPSARFPTARVPVESSVPKKAAMLRVPVSSA